MKPTAPLEPNREFPILEARQYLEDHLKKWFPAWFREVRIGPIGCPRLVIVSTNKAETARWIRTNLDEWLGHRLGHHHQPEAEG